MARFLAAWGYVDGTPVVFTRPADGAVVPRVGLRDVRELEAESATAAAEQYAQKLVDEGIMQGAALLSLGGVRLIKKDEPS